jgi:hypothetical protein
MRKVTAIMVALIFTLGIASLGFSAEKALDKCASCHKGDKALDKIAAKKNMKSAGDFTKAAKEGPASKMHAKFNDNDLKAAAKELKLAE